MALRAPTPLNSIDLQCGQRVEISPAAVPRIVTLSVSLRRTRHGDMSVTAVAAPAPGRAARLARCPNLLRCSQVGLRQSDPCFRAQNLALVSLQYSFVHP